MPSQYIYQLHVVAPDQVAQQLSAAAYALSPDVGENNVSTELVPANGDAAAEATALCFSAPVTQQHIDVLFGAGLSSTPGVHWWRTDRDGMLQKRWDNDTPDPTQFTFANALAEEGLQLRVVPSGI